MYIYKQTGGEKQREREREREGERERDRDVHTQRHGVRKIASGEKRKSG